MKQLLIATLLLASPVIGEPLDGPVGKDRDLMAALIIAEAGGEPRKHNGKWDYTSLEAVYEVIWMRAVQRKQSYWRVMTAEFQFQPLNKPMTPSGLIAKHRGHSHYKWVHGELLKWPPLTCHTGPVSTKRADHFHDISIKAPYWAKSKRAVQINRLKFYRLGY